MLMKYWRKLPIKVGDGNNDHQCWEWPEDMDTPRTLKQVNASSPGTEVAVDASAALSSAAIAWKKFNSSYSRILLQQSKSVGIKFMLF
jgi:endoglucanase